MASLSEVEKSSRRTVWLEGQVLCLLDQRALPHRRVVLRLESYRQSVQAIREMAVRGAGTIGAAGAFAMAQAVLAAPPDRFQEEIEQARAAVSGARPTAKNLSYGVERVVRAVRSARGVEEARVKAAAEAQAVYDDDVRMTEKIAEAGLGVLPGGKAVLTHCNAGWLAYPGWGTALAPLYLAHSTGRPVFVIATETRPRSQGAKLTTWELSQAGVPHALIADTAAGSTMAQGEIGAVIVGADRIAANGDTANKVGTYTLAVLAKAHGIPFYVAAPSPTFDAECPSGAQIPIEERDEREVLEVEGAVDAGAGTLASVRVATPGVRARNPAFDVTPASYITAFITECGLIQPNRESVGRFFASTAEGRAPAALQPSSTPHPTTEKTSAAGIPGRPPQPSRPVR